MTDATDGRKYLINCAHGAGDVERATIALILAATASRTCETAIFATSDAAGICVKGGADGLIAKGYEPLSDLMNQFRGNGGKSGIARPVPRPRGSPRAI